MAYDQSCFELAAQFLSDEDPDIFGPEKAEELAQLIQTTIEDFIADEKGENEEDETEGESEEL